MMGEFSQAYVLLTRSKHCPARLLSEGARKELTITAHDTRDSGHDALQKRLCIDFVLGPIIHVRRARGAEMLLFAIKRQELNESILHTQQIHVLVHKMLGTGLDPTLLHAQNSFIGGFGS